MRLSTYIQRIRALGDLKVEPHIIDALGEEIAAGADFGTLLSKRSEKLIPLILLGIWRASARHSAHQTYLGTVAQRRIRQGEDQIPSALLKQTVARHEVTLMERATALTPAGRASEHRRRDAIKAAVSLWNSCLAITRKEAALTVALDTARSDLVDEFGGFTGKSNLSEIPGHRWLAIRRGERLGALSLSFELPLERMHSQVAARAVELSPISAGREDDLFFEALVLPELEEWALCLKDDEAQLLAIRSATNAYLGLLNTEAADHPVLAAISVPRKGSLGVAITLRDGRLVGQGEVHDVDSAVQALERIIGKHPVEAIVLPVESARKDLMETVLAGFQSLHVHKVSSKAMGHAVSLIENDLSSSVKRALVLAQRVTQPKSHWLSLDPMKLGLAEYQHELDADVLGLALDDMKALARAGLGPSDLTLDRGAAARPKARVSMKNLNPMVRNVEDLRSGMEIQGIVTNITQFGAFINIGLSHEGLVHVSELADHFVSDPNEVVTIGQQVKASVLGVDRGRRRISLSLRTDRSQQPQQKPSQAIAHDRIDGPGGGGVPLDDIPGRGGRRQSPRMDRPAAAGVSRSQALADLEALFKKK